jgi:hypothetical protein
MEIVVALIVPALGTLLIIGAVWLAYGRRDTALAGPVEARRRFDEDWPAFAQGDLLVSADGRAALSLEAGGRRIALVYAFGDRLPTRIIEPREIAEVRLDGGMLILSTRDFGHPDFILALPPGEDGEAWRARLAALSARAAAA